MSDEHAKKTLNTIKKVLKSPTYEPPPRKTTQNYDPNNYKGVTWNKDRKAYDYNLD
jgi:hypothetical protein